jgi:hypothetical protein
MEYLEGQTLAKRLDTPALATASVGSLLSATVTARGEAFEPGSPKEIVRIPALNFPHSGGDYPTYAVRADGKQILMVRLVHPTQPPLRRKLMIPIRP